MLVLDIPEQPYDLIGDIHGEFDALMSLIKHLGYNEHGEHPQYRKLIFLGDLGDRGMKSASTMRWVKRAVERGCAYAINGNHELNILQNDPKDGSGWWFHERLAQEMHQFGIVEEIADYEKNNYIAFLKSLPIAITTPSLRIVHAMWHQASIERIINLNHDAYHSFHNQIAAAHPELRQQYLAEQHRYEQRLSDVSRAPPELPFTQEYNLIYQNQHPFRLLTSGEEGPAEHPFFAAGKWRVTARMPWWHEYTDKTPVIIGHYWREWQPRSHHEVFGDAHPHQWLGPNHNVFCIDYSVGKRYRMRKGHHESTALVALRWPECQLMHERGHMIQLTLPNSVDD